MDRIPYPLRRGIARFPRLSIWRDPIPSDAAQGDDTFGETGPQPAILSRLRATTAAPRHSPFLSTAPARAIRADMADMAQLNDD
ncbi:hypothetical protein [Roseivivax sp. CAU 1761]